MKLITAADPIKAELLDLLQSGPKTAREMIERINADGKQVAARLKMLLKAEEISRVEINVGRYRYYIGQTAPGYKGYIPDRRRAKTPTERKAMSYAIPVRHVISEPMPGQHTNKITLPLEPWAA